MKVKPSIFLILILLSNTIPKEANANSIVCMKSSLGDYCLELFDSIAPVTVANFLSYVNEEQYNKIIFHRSVPGFILQTGGFTITSDVKLQEITNKGTVINEFNLPNTRGTIAMAKVGGAPDSASNQWFINLADNTANLDNQNGGFTVFGRVIDDGMQVIDSISNLTEFNFGGVLAETPTINFTGEGTVNQDNFVFIENAQTLIADKNTASFQSNYLIVVIDAGNLGVFNSKFKLIQANSQFLFTLDLSILSQASENAISQGIFNPSTGILTLPKVKLSEENILNNVVLQLTDSINFTFTLQSIDGQVY